MFDDDNYDDIGTETQRIIIPYEPRAWQADIHRQLRRFNVIVCHRGAGKALALDTVVPTPDGYTTMGEVQPGMMVIDRDGNACRVKAISGVMHDRECYEVVFNTGERVVCDGEHLWTTQTTLDEAPKTATAIADTITLDHHVVSYGSIAHNRMIVAVNPVPSVPVQCIEVESPSSTFCVTRSFIPTHNSVLCMNQLIRAALSGPPAAEYVYLLPLRNQAKRNVWVPFKRFLDPIPGIHYDNAALEATLPNDSKIMVLGADNPESLRGLHLHGIVLDEFSDMHANTWRAVRPMLSNHDGWAIWIGTPKGHNEFFRKYMQSLEPNRPNWFGAFMPYWATNALSAEEIEQMKTEMLPEEFAQELECSFDSALIGSYYGKQLSEQRDRGYISPNPLYRTDLEVYTAWDLGIRDKMAVWFFQLVDNEIAFIDFEQHSNFGFKEWKALLDLKKQHYWYQYAIHIAPFDIKNREIGSGISRLESAEQVGIRFEICPKQDIMDGIEIVRRHLPRCRFHSIMCEEGLEALMMYRAKVDRMGNGLGPQHDESSHASDSLRYAMTYVTQVLNKPAILRLPFLRNR